MLIGYHFRRFFKGLSSQSCSFIFTKMLSRIKATRLDKCQLNLAIALRAFRMRMVMRADQICIITAFSVVPIKVPVKTAAALFFLLEVQLVVLVQLFPDCFVQFGKTMKGFI